jgi:hypothetical protein
MQSRFEAEVAAQRELCRSSVRLENSRQFPGPAQRIMCGCPFDAPAALLFTVINRLHRNCIFD